MKPLGKDKGDKSESNLVHNQGKGMCKVKTNHPRDTKSYITNCTPIHFNLDSTCMGY
jgi:hypothetical protein